MRWVQIRALSEFWCRITLRPSCDTLTNQNTAFFSRKRSVLDATDIPKTQICFRNRFLRNAMKSMLDSITAMLLFTRYQYQWTMTDRAPTAEGQRGFEMTWMVYGFAHYMLDFRGSSHFETWICNSEIFDTFSLLLPDPIFPGFRQFGSNNGLSWVLISDHKAWGTFGCIHLKLPGPGLY